MTYDLICEGPCNPDLGGIDMAVLKERREMRLDGRALPISDVLTMRLRKLRHTLHEPKTTTTAICQTCGVSRRFGVM